MNRTGLVIALVIGAAVGLVTGVFPQVDIAVSHLFFDDRTKSFPASINLYALLWRYAFIYLIVALAAPAFIAVVVKLLLPRRRMLIAGRAVVFLITTLALAPGLMANVILKDHWGRPRPYTITEFNGDAHFIPWWDPRGDCDANCSFVAGEGASSFWTLAPAALVPPPWRALACGAALVFGAAVSALRIAVGAHFFSDAAFAGLFTFLIIWTMHGLIYRWPATRISDEQVERTLAGVTLPVYRALERLVIRIGTLLRGRGAGERP